MATFEPDRVLILTPTQRHLTGEFEKKYIGAILFITPRDLHS